MALSKTIMHRNAQNVIKAVLLAMDYQHQIVCLAAALGCAFPATRVTHCPTVIAMVC